MKKLFSLALVLVMALTCLSASADTLTAKLAFNTELLKSTLSMFGVDEQTLASTDPVFDLINSLGVKVGTYADGVEVDLDLNGEMAAGIGVLASESGLAVASTLFPNYLVTVSPETIQQLMEQMMAMIPAQGSADNGSDAAKAVFGEYFKEYIDAVSNAGTPGAPVSGSFEFDGITYDTCTPVNIDFNVVKKATSTLYDKVLADPAAMTMIKGYVKNSVEKSGKEFDEAAFEADFKTGLEESIKQIPDTAVTNVYTNSSAPNAFYMTCNAQKDGKDTINYIMHVLDQSNMKIECKFLDPMPMKATFEMTDYNVRIGFSVLGLEAAVNVTLHDNGFVADLFFLNPDEAIMSLSVETAPGGERGVSMEVGERKVLGVDEIMQDPSGEVVSGLLMDMMTNGLGSVMTVVYEQVPSFAAMLSSNTAAAQ